MSSKTERKEMERQDFVSVEFGWWNAGIIQKSIDQMGVDLIKIRGIDSFTPVVGRREIKVIGVDDHIHYEVTDYASLRHTGSENQYWNDVESREYTSKDLGDL